MLSVRDVSFDTQFGWPRRQCTCVICLRHYIVPWITDLYRSRYAHAHAPKQAKHASTGMCRFIGMAASPCQPGFQPCLLLFACSTSGAAAKLLPALGTCVRMLMHGVPPSSMHGVHRRPALAAARPSHLNLAPLRGFILTPVASINAAAQLALNVQTPAAFGT